MDRSGIQAAFDDAFDQALVFHGFTDYMRDYDLYLHATADPRTGIAPEYRRYRFTHCVNAAATSALPPGIWRHSLDERLLDYERGGDIDGYVWGVKWQMLYPGMKLVGAPQWPFSRHPAWPAAWALMWVVVAVGVVVATRRQILLRRWRRRFIAPPGPDLPVQGR